MVVLNIRNIFVCFVIVTAVAIAQVYVLKGCHHQTKAVIMRIEFVIIIQIIMFIFSYIIWKNFKDLHLSSQVNRESTDKMSSETEGEGASTLAERFHTSRKHSLWRVSIVLYLCMCHLSYLTNLFFIDKDPYWIGMLAYACLGSFIQLNTGLIIFKSLSKIFKMSLFKGFPSAFYLSGIHKKKILLYTLIYMILASMYGLYNASQPPRVKNVAIPVKDLPTNLHGLTIVQLSDIHLGPTVGFTKLQMIVNIVNKEKPDIIVLTGDLADGKANALSLAAEPMKDLVSKYGNFFVTGNHEYYTGDVDNWFSLLESMGFTILHNSNVRIPPTLSETEQTESATGQICLAGTDDLQADRISYGDHGFDLLQATATCSTELPVILLAHQPKAAKQALDSKFRIDVVLSGHTHGGQMFPLMVGAYLLNPFYAGLYKVDNSHVYVSKGTQYWGIPMRIGASMEITKITLVPWN